MCSQIAREAAELAAGADEHDAARSALILAAARADELVTDLKQQIAALAGQKSNLDHKLLAARNLVMQATGLPARALPFAGELIDVIDPAWAGAAERVLGGLGRTMLVADEHADDVAAAAARASESAVKKRMCVGSSSIHQDSPWNRSPSESPAGVSIWTCPPGRSSPRAAASVVPTSSTCSRTWMP